MMQCVKELKRSEQNWRFLGIKRGCYLDNHQHNLGLITPSMYLRSVPSSAPGHQATAWPKQPASHGIRCQATTGAAEPASAKERPDWTGSSYLSSIVNVIVRIPAVKSAAKALFKNSLRKQNVDWDSYVLAAEAARTQLAALKAQNEDPAVVYPPYYLKDFHSYDDGNLSWLAASEVEPATLATAWRAYKDPTLDPYQANDKMRSSIVSIIEVDDGDPCALFCVMHHLGPGHRPTNKSMHVGQLRPCSTSGAL